jgi:hypothetical protein
VYQVEEGEEDFAATWACLCEGVHGYWEEGAESDVAEVGHAFEAYTTHNTLVQGDNNKAREPALAGACQVAFAVGEASQRTAHCVDAVLDVGLACQSKDRHSGRFETGEVYHWVLDGDKQESEEDHQQGQQIVAAEAGGRRVYRNVPSVMIGKERLAVK